MVDVTLQPANENEVADTVAVMGGEDWRRWMDLLLEENLLAEGARALAYSYIQAGNYLADLPATMRSARRKKGSSAASQPSILTRTLARNGKAPASQHAWVSVNKAVVTQASAAIPVVPLYLSLLPLPMKKKGLDEGPLEQMRRLFGDFLCSEQAAETRRSRAPPASRQICRKCCPDSSGPSGRAVAAGYNRESPSEHRFRRLSARISWSLWI